MIASLVATLGLAALAVLSGGALEIAAGVALVIALAALARSAIRLAGDEARREVSGPPGRG